MSNACESEEKKWAGLWCLLSVQKWRCFLLSSGFTPFPQTFASLFSNCYATCICQKKEPSHSLTCADFLGLAFLVSSVGSIDYNRALCVMSCCVLTCIDSVISVSLYPQQQSHEKYDVVRRPGDQRACSENLQEPGTESATGGVCGCEATRGSSLNNVEMYCVQLLSQIRHDYVWVAWCLCVGAEGIRFCLFFLS